MESRTAKARVASGLIAALARADRRGGDQQRANRRRTQTPIKIGFMVPLSGGNVQNGRDILNGFLLYAGRDRLPRRRTTDRAHRRRRRGDSGGGADEGAKADRARQGPHDGRRAAVVHRLRAGAVHRLDADPDGLPGRVRRRPDAAAAEQVDRAHRLERQPAQSCVRRVRVSHAEACGRWRRSRSTTRSDGSRSAASSGRSWREGGTIAQKIWCPVSVHDFAPYLAQISRDVDAVYALVLGRAALQFMRQYQEFGLKGRVLTHRRRHDDRRARAAVHGRRGARRRSRRFTTAPRWTRRRTGNSRRAYRARYKKVPSYYSESMYTRRASGSSRRSRRCTAASKTRRRLSTRCDG